MQPEEFLKEHALFLFGTEAGIAHAVGRSRQAVNLWKALEPIPEGPASRIIYQIKPQEIAANRLEMRAVSLLGRLAREIRDGVRAIKGTAYAEAKDEFGLTGSRERVFDQLNDRVRADRIRYAEERAA